MNNFGICVIGAGPRGLTLLERIDAHSRSGDRHVVVHLVDPGTPGVGVHPTDQPRYWLLNSVLGLPTMFPGELNVDSTLQSNGPSLLTWLQDKGASWLGEDFSLLAHTFQAKDFVPRRYLGAYLNWFYSYLLERMQERVTVKHYQAEAITIENKTDREYVHLTDGSCIECHAVILATGHTRNAPELSAAGEPRRIENIYRDPARLMEIGSRDIVGIEGLGLTAMDAVSALTLGKGGRYSKSDGYCKYHPSGTEPRIVLYSRTGVPYRARPAGDEGTFDYVPSARFTRVVETLKTRGRPQVDFDQQFWPVLRREMQIAYFAQHRRLESARGSGEGDGWLAWSQLSDTAVDQWLSDMSHRFGEWDIEQALYGTADLDLAGAAQYELSVLKFIQADLAEAKRGFSSPLKQGLEVLLHLREGIRAAVNHAGLTAHSHESFYKKFVPIINRNVIGPPLERLEELTALVEAGVLSMPLGPAPALVKLPDEKGWEASSTLLSNPQMVHLSWLVNGYFESPRADRSASRLIRHLHGAGRITKSRHDVPNALGAAVTPGLNALNADGLPNSRLFLVGPLCEGSTYYNHYVPTVHPGSTPFVEAEMVVSAIFSNDCATVS